MDMYECQESRVVWNNEYGEYFTSTNGVHQEGIISPLMFTLYMDELIKELKVSGIGCHIGHGYLGCLQYADDLKLMCPEIKVLQKMISICETFGEKYSVKYNEKKSMCISFDRARDRNSYFNDNVNTILNGSLMKWQTL